MSINITVSGKIDKNCRPLHSLLEDPQFVQQEQEKQRRKLRIIQVRERAKHVAKTIRNNVAKERKRCLNNYHRKKEEEIKNWRKAQMARENYAYKTALTCIGQAHRAATEENNKQNTQKSNSVPYKQFKKTIRKSLVKETKPNKLDKSVCTESKSYPDKESKCAYTQTQSNMETNKKVLIQSAPSSASEDTEEEGETESSDEDICANIIINSNSDNSDSSIENNCEDENDEGLKSLSLTRKCKPALVLDVEVDSQDTIDIMPAYEMKDNHKERKKQFSSVLRISPKKQKQCTQESQQKQSGKNSKQHTKCSKKSSSSSSTPITEETTSSTQCTATTTIKQKKCLQKNIKSNCEKRFSTISTLIQKQKEQSPKATCISPKKSPKLLESTGTFTIIRTPPKICDSPKTYRTVKITSLNKHNSPVSTSPNRLTTLHSPRKHCSTSTGYNSGKVQFFGCGNKTPEECMPCNTLPNLLKAYQSPPKRCDTATNRGSDKVQFSDCTSRISKENMRPNPSISQQSPRKRCITSIDNNSYKVQFYNYNNKMSKGYATATLDQPIVHRHSNNSTCNAMENALREKELEKKREVYVFQQKKTSEDRGKKALEREQIRRDCHELTEKLEALSRKYPREMSNQFNDPHIFADKGLRNESKMNAAIEEILSRPAIITCPEVQNKENVQKNQSSNLKKCATVPNILNLADKSSPIEVISSDSCSSILLGYVDNQNKNTQPNLDCKNDIAQSKENTAQLKNLLKRLDGLRECLLKELKSENNEDSKNAENIINCLNKVCNEYNKNGIKNVSQSGKNKKCNGHEPVEIVITVKGDRHNVEVPELRSKKTKKTSSLGKKIQPKTVVKTPKKKCPKKNPIESIVTQTSYDSNSTSYRSLPKQISPEMDCLATTSTNNQIKSTALDEDNKIPRLNPLIAQYVQRLLGMSHGAIEKLGISSSDVPTPTSTIVNTSENIPDVPSIADERLKCMQKFLEENHSFVKELEETLRACNSKVSMEESIEQIWCKRFQLASSNNQKQETNINENKTKTTHLKPVENSKSLKEKRKEPTDIQKYNKSTKVAVSPAKVVERKSAQSPQKLQVKKTKQTINKGTETQRSEVSVGGETARKLTESCAQRIAELTELINRVRAEKQRLLEVTLSSISDNGRQSTEYLTLPYGSESGRKSVGEGSKSQSSSTKTTNLQRAQPFAASRDSGIHDSRPTTGLDILVDNEADLQASKGRPVGTAGQRKSKPPSTIKSISPELIEDGEQHELSTILEVDTPATSKVNVCPPQDSSFKEPVQSTQPLLFPSFEEYVKQLNLDTSQLNAAQKRLLEQDFCRYIELLEQCRKYPHYKEFPSLRTYMRQCGWRQNIDVSEVSSTTSDDNMQRISTITPQVELSNCREYTLSVVKPHTQREQCSSSSIDNNDSSSIDIEAELKRRNIIQHSFQIEPTTTNIESGLEKLSSSCITIDKLEESLKRLVMQWSTNCSNKSEKQCELSDMQSETTKKSSPCKDKRSHYSSSSRNKSVNGKSGGNQALRDFLTKELLKHANLSASTSTITDDSLCSQFLHSIIGTLSPRSDGTTNNREIHKENSELHKTSTPIPSSAITQPSTTLKLFSAESCFSSVKVCTSGSDVYNIDCSDQADKSSS